MKIERMLYRRYKSNYSDCDIVPGTYDKATKTIDVFIPDGREKTSGVRGQKFHTYRFDGVDNVTGNHVTCAIKAVCMVNAVKRLPKNCTWEIG